MGLLDRLKQQKLAVENNFATQLAKEISDVAEALEAGELGFISEDKFNSITAGLEMLLSGEGDLPKTGRTRVKTPVLYNSDAFKGLAKLDAAGLKKLKIDDLQNRMKEANISRQVGNPKNYTDAQLKDKLIERILTAVSEQEDKDE